MKKILLLGMLLLGSVWAAVAQTTPYVKISYFSSTASKFAVTDPTGATLVPNLGMKLSAGYTIATSDCTVELELVPNKSIIKVNKNTVISINSLIGLNNANSNEFGLTEGKIRVVATKLGANPDGTTPYVFKTKGSVAGVRGTDFGIDVGDNTKKALLVVKEGIVDYTKSLTKEKVTLESGMMADAFASAFATNQLSPEEMADFFSDLEFDQLKPAQVPGNAGNKQVNINTNPTDGGSSEDPAKTAAETEADKNLKQLFDLIGLEIGSVVLDGNTYGKAVLQPKIITPDFKMGFYLPVIYKDDLFDPSTWHHPNGNNEWSFGTDQNGEVLPIIADVWNDLILKIKFIEIGNDLSPFSLQFGNLSSMSLGHGALINEYANDAEFPSVRRAGLKVGINPKELGLQFLVGDLGQPDLVGFRYVLKPSPDVGLGIGVGLAADFNPDRVIEKNTADSKLKMVQDLDPIITGLSFDIEFPFELLGAKLMPYADIGFLMPILQHGGSGFNEGAQFQSILDVLTLRNYGWFVGLKGEIPLIVTNLDFRAQFEFENGAYKIGYFGNAYDRTRAEQAADLINSLTNMSGNPLFYNPSVGIHGELGAEIFGILRLGGGYTWPWKIENDQIVQGDADEFGLSLGFLRDKLPFGIGFKVEYIRTHFKELFYDDNFTIFDEYATLRGGFTLPVGEFFRLKLTVGTATKKDAGGAIVVDKNGNPVIYPTFSILTAIGDSED